MKYYSDVLKKVFDTPEELQKEEAAAKKLEVKKEESRKALSTRVEAAEKEVDAAYKHYEEICEKAAKILDEANEKVTVMLREAKDQIRSAEEEKTKAIQKFSEKFGTYTTTYTGNKALQEFQKITDRLKDDFVFPFFWY